MNTKAIEKKLDEIFKDYSSNVPGAAIGIISNGELFTKCYGLSNLQNSTLVTPETNFCLASISKAYTAACILKLIEEGKLSLSNCINDVIPDFPEYGRSITIKHLLQHTSGIQETTYHFTKSPDEFLKQLRRYEESVSVPGSKYEYSNAGYALLGIIVSMVSGTAFPDYMDKTIFKPLDMSGTVLYLNGYNMVENRSYGYFGKDGGYKLNDKNDSRLLLGSGGVFSSLIDMYKWDQALYSEKLLTFENLNEAFTPGRLSNGDFFGYGYGWMVANVSGLRLLFHYGDTAGFRNCFVRLPDERFSMIILTNRDSLDFVTRKDDLMGELLITVKLFLSLK
ncbi:beta-lactamase family protein [Candidatus Bathyarchaeota archaeon]|nr:beta-lactamase family protein [Candidatus Bathyarchaeota archaeon]